MISEAKSYLFYSAWLITIPGATGWLATRCTSWPG
jgi:hypothetical protein